MSIVAVSYNLYTKLLPFSGVVKELFMIYYLIIVLLF